MLQLLLTRGLVAVPQVTSFQRGYCLCAMGRLTQSVRAGERGRGPWLWLHQGSHQEPWPIANGPSLRMQCGLGGHEAHGKAGRLHLAPGAQVKLELRWAATRWWSSQCRRVSAWTTFFFRIRRVLLGERVGRAFEGPSENSPVLQSRPSLSKHFQASSLSLNP